jgi:hypothetical protein
VVVLEGLTEDGRGVRYEFAHDQALAFVLNSFDVHRRVIDFFELRFEDGAVSICCFDKKGNQLKDGFVPSIRAMRVPDITF